MNHAGQAQRKGKEPYRILLTILTGIAGIALFGGILLMSQSRMAELALQEEMKENSSYITNAFTYYEASGKTIQGWRSWPDGIWRSIRKRRRPTRWIR